MTVMTADLHADESSTPRYLTHEGITVIGSGMELMVLCVCVLGKKGFTQEARGDPGGVHRAWCNVPENIRVNGEASLGIPVHKHGAVEIELAECLRQILFHFLGWLKVQDIIICNV